MAGSPRTHPDATTTSGGALLALAGLLMLGSLAGAGDWSALLLPADVALAIGCVVLAVRSDGIAGAPRPGRIALAAAGIGPLVSRLPIQLVPAPVLLGMTILVVLTVATVVAAVAVARNRGLSGIARWAPVLLAADAVLLLAMSSVPLEQLSTVFADARLALIRPLVLLVWGLSIMLLGRAAAIRSRAAALNASWKRSTAVGGVAPDPAVRTDSRS